MGRSLAVGVLAALVGCGGAETRTFEVRRVSPAVDPACGAPADGRTMLVTALGDFAPGQDVVRSFDVAGGRFTIAGFPDQTQALELEVLGAGGAPRTVGRSGGFDLGALADGAVIPVFMAPPRGFCPTGPMTKARDRPLLARAGDKILVAGGRDQDGAPVTSLELYDPATGGFAAVPGATYGEGLAGGLDGASLTTLPDGRVLLLGGGATAYQLFDPVTGTLGQPSFLREAHTHHVAVVDPGSGDVLLVGGCAQAEGDGCTAGTAVTHPARFDVATGTLAALAETTRPRLDGAAVFAGDELILVGGRDADGSPLGNGGFVRLADGTDEQPLALAASRAALLASGAVLAHDGATGAAWVVSGTAAVVAQAGAARPGASVTALEDGHVAILGGTDGGELYRPLENDFAPLGAWPARSGHGAIGLGDGSVLVVGGRDAGGTALAEAWIFRPDLLGPLSPGVTLTFADAELGAALVPSNPALVRRVSDGGATHLELTSPGQAVIAGPVVGDLELAIRLASSTGVRLDLDRAPDRPGDGRSIALISGQPASATARQGGAPSDAGDCTARVVGDLSGPSHQVTAIRLAGDLRVTVDGAEVLRCTGATGRGQVGLAAPSGVLRVDVVQLSR